ncbi:MAG: nuclear transport factor 2 family protein [Planctomycetia bacterium]
MKRRRYGLWISVAGLVALAMLGMVNREPSAAPSARPIPEVISKPRRFQMAAVPDDAPIFMERPADLAQGPIRVVATTDLPVTRPLSFPASPFTTTPGGPLPSSAPAVSEIRDMMRSYLRAFNRHDTAALASHWSATGESIDLDSGDSTKGRDAVAGVFASLFERDADATIDIEIDSIKLVRSDVAVVDGVSLLSFNDATRAGSRFSAVVVREQETWVLSSVRETAVPVPTTGRPLEQLDWLAGSWEDLGDELTATTHCSWNASRSFLTRSHVVAIDTGVERSSDGIPSLLPTGDTGPREISEIIGWDPGVRQIRSWVFTSDGRFAEGVWSRDGEAWRVRYEGRGADAGATCDVTIERPGPDELVIRCQPSPLGDVIPPVADFVRTAYLGR